MSTERTVLIRLEMGWSGLPRGTELWLPRGKANDLINRGIAALLAGNAGDHTTLLSTYERK